MLPILLLATMIGCSVGGPFSRTFVQPDCRERTNGILWLGGCASFSACVDGDFRQTDCPSGSVVHSELAQCTDPASAPFPCNQPPMDCSGHPLHAGYRLPLNRTDPENGSFPLCRAYYTCSYGRFISYQWCPENTVYDELNQRCGEPLSVQPPCGTALVDLDDHQFQPDHETSFPQQPPEQDFFPQDFLVVENPQQNPSFLDGTFDNSPNQQELFPPFSRPQGTVQDFPPRPPGGDGGAGGASSSRDRFPIVYPQQDQFQVAQPSEPALPGQFQSVVQQQVPFQSVVQQQNPLQSGLRQNPLQSGQQQTSLQSGFRQEPLQSSQRRDQLQFSQQQESFQSGQRPNLPQSGQRPNLPQSGQQQGLLQPGQQQNPFQPGQIQDQFQPGQIQDQFQSGQQQNPFAPGQIQDQFQPGQIEDQFQPGQIQDQFQSGQQQIPFQPGQRPNPPQSGQIQDQFQPSQQNLFQAGASDSQLQNIPQQDQFQPDLQPQDQFQQGSVPSGLEEEDQVVFQQELPGGTNPQNLARPQQVPPQNQPSEPFPIRSVNNPQQQEWTQIQTDTNRPSNPQSNSNNNNNNDDVDRQDDFIPQGSPTLYGGGRFQRNLYQQRQNWNNRYRL